MATKLVSMKLDPKSREEMSEPSSIATDAPAYPYGLEVRLDGEALEKLGYDVTDFKVGSSMTLIAKVEVTGISSNASKGGENQSCSLQITDMCLEDGATKAASATKALYNAED